MNRVLVVLSISALAALWGFDFAVVQANRIVAGSGHGLIDALGLLPAAAVSFALLIVIASGVYARTLALWVALGLSTLLIMSLPFALAQFAYLYIDAGQQYARVSMATGAWVALFLLSLIIVECQQRLAWPQVLRPVPLLLILATLFYALELGLLDSLGLLQEYRTRSDQFRRALWEHLQLVGGAVGISLSIGFVLAIQMLRRPRWQKPVLAVLSFFQTIPSLALFGLLIAPLAWASAQWPVLQQFGIRGIGWAPAMLALIGYSLLPIVRNTWAALREVPAEVLESARGMGMSPNQVFLQVQLPLALPIVLEGIRITAIQAIGLTAVAALIGAGGFGTFIFQGLGQAANELIMLGALPILLLALLTDTVLSSIADFLRQPREATRP